MELDDFEGCWRLDRRIRHDDSAEASFEGQAVAERGPSGLVWREEGRLTLPDGRVVAAERTLLWGDAPGGVAVRFADGRLFHRIDLGAVRPRAEHLCGADLYTVSYDFAAWPRWTARWRVDGPRHAYAMETRHAPLAGPGAMGHPGPA